ncbi:MAG: glycosyl transferase [Rhodothermaceae bacterium]|nr:MAG: glycosyl transferase [Rhodothermaceae bacterium]
MNTTQPTPIGADTPRTLTTLQIGMGWFPEQAGGLNRVFFNLLPALRTTGVRVRGLVAGARGDGGDVRSFARREDPLWRRWAGVRRAVREEMARTTFDLVASHFALYTMPVRHMLAPLPLVVHFHGPWALESEVEGDRFWSVWFKQWVERRVYGQAVRFIVLSEAFAGVLRERYGVANEWIRVVPGGVDLRRFTPTISREAARERLGWPRDRFIVLAVRRLAHRMGLEQLIDAMVRVREAHPDVLLVIAGQGPMRTALQARIEERGLAAHVRLVGFVADDDLPHAYRAADVSIVPTQAFEGFGLITVESLAAGTPVLVTPVGGLPEVVRDLAETLVLPGNTVADLAGGLIEVIRGTRGLPEPAMCRAYAEARFDWAVVARQTRSVYEEVVA